MAMSDCSKCWDTPCTCGWKLRNRSIGWLENQKRIIEKALEFKKLNPNAKHALLFGNKKTKDDERYYKFIQEEKENGENKTL